MKLEEKSFILVLGATAAQHYLYHTARDMGIRTIAVDMNPKALSFNLADESYPISIFDFDRLEKLCVEKNVSGIIGFGLDVTVKAAAQLSERLKLPGLSPKVAENGTNKGKMKIAFQRYGIPTPDFHIIETLSEANGALNDLGLPAIIKPTDNAAKRGITILQEGTDVENAINHALNNSKEKKAIIEQFIEGTLVFAPTFVDGEKSHISVMDQEAMANLVQIQFKCPSLLPEATQETVRHYAKLCAESLGISQGGLHTEMIVAPDGVPYLIETSPRTSYATVALSRFVLGFDPVKNIINLALNKKTEIPNNNIQGEGILQHLQPNPGTIFKKERLINLSMDQRIKELTFFISDGDRVNEFRTNMDRVGYFVTHDHPGRELERFTKKEKEFLEKTVFS